MVRPSEPSRLTAMSVPCTGWIVGAAGMSGCVVDGCAEAARAAVLRTSCSMSRLPAVGAMVCANASLGAAVARCRCRRRSRPRQPPAAPRAAVAAPAPTSALRAAAASPPAASASPPATSTAGSPPSSGHAHRADAHRRRLRRRPVRRRRAARGRDRLGRRRVAHRRGRRRPGRRASQALPAVLAEGEADRRPLAAGRADRLGRLWPGAPPPPAAPPPTGCSVAATVEATPIGRRRRLGHERSTAHLAEVHARRVHRPARATGRPAAAAAGFGAAVPPPGDGRNPDRTATLRG